MRTAEGAIKQLSAPAAAAAAVGRCLLLLLKAMICCLVHPRFCHSAEKFGTEYVDPSQRRDMRLDAHKERFNRPGFATGIVSW